MKTMKFTTTKLVEHNGKNYVIKNTFRDGLIFSVFNSNNKKQITATENRFGKIPECNIVTKDELERAINSHQTKFESILFGEFKNDDLGFFKYYETSFDVNSKSKYLRRWIRTEFFEEDYYKELTNKN